MEREKLHAAAYTKSVRCVAAGMMGDGDVPRALFGVVTIRGSRRRYQCNLGHHTTEASTRFSM